eukprot:gene41328-55899_t
MCRLLPDYPDFTAVIVGEIKPDQEEFANQLRRQIAAAGLQTRIIITGELPIADVQRWYQRLTIYAFTSRNEGFGLTLIEAMAAGAALVATRAGAAELAVDDGVTGVLVPVDDADALTAALQPLMRDPSAAAAMGARGRQRVLDKFSLDAEAAGIAVNVGNEGIEIATCEQVTRQSGCGAGLDIWRAIADHETARMPDRPMLHQIENHAGAGFAPRVILEIAGDRAGGMVRAIADVVDHGAFGFQLGAHPVMQLSARDAGLVGENEYQIAGVVEATDGLCRIGHPADRFRLEHMMVIVIDDTVAVEKRGGSKRAGGAHGWLASVVILRSTSSQMPWSAAR